MVFTAAAIMSAVAALASLVRGSRYVHEESRRIGGVQATIAQQSS